MSKIMLWNYALDFLDFALDLRLPSRFT
jgi:hypothetical protein